MQTKISFYFIGVLAAFALIKARPQTFNNYPYRPTFSDLDPYNYYYTTPMPYNSQNLVRIWPYVVDQAVSPLYNLNQGSNGYLSNSGYSSTLNNGYGGTYSNTGVVYNPTGYLSNPNIPGYGTTIPPYLSNTNPFGIYNGKK
ncbi:uncharacterized protein LOC129908470 isoform X1 [Episyrphus balteatus]|uniref:uncharacterized protein LOC129908470 isoform X1 n=1 Tax=Episyrphus balteatus TaxID=286459 RepID=UPI002485643B|nr:uncharacterized protein LOC129908470 isoform X1 [Episyrphus balteatus]